jgi:uncharacterized membrane protein
MTSFSKKEALRFGWTTFKSKPWIFIGAAAILMVVSIIISKLSDGRDMMSGIIGIVGTIVQWWLYLGLMRMALRTYAGGVPSINQLFGESWKTLLQYAILAIVSGVLVGIGLILLIVPGIIVATMVSLAPLLLLERGMNAIPALKESRRLTEGHRMNIFLFMLILIVLNIIGALALWVGLLVTVPISMLAFVYVYKQVEKGVAVESATTPMPAASVPSASA